MAARTTQTVLTLQGMEQRAVPASMANGNLYVIGTPGNDVVEVRRIEVGDTGMIQVTQNGMIEQYKASRVHQIKFWGLDGDDTFESHVSKDVVALGGNGNDHLTTAGGNDRLYGGNGRDVLKAGSGNDTLYGGDGHDWLQGGAGNDKLHGEKGNDVLSGGNGNDRLHGGLGKDVVFGGSGNDEFWGATQDLGPLSAPLTTPDGTANFYGIQDAGTGDTVWS